MKEGGREGGRKEREHRRVSNIIGEMERGGRNMKDTNCNYCNVPTEVIHTAFIGATALGFRPAPLSVVVTICPA